MGFTLSRLLQSESGPWPPPPHDPRERICLGLMDEWEVRIFARSDCKFQYLARKKMLHVQLWHPVVWVSVLTPSQLTAGRFELFPFKGWKCSPPCLHLLNRILHEELGAPRIDERLLGIIEHNFIHAEVTRMLNPPDESENVASNAIKLEG